MFRYGIASGRLTVEIFFSLPLYGYISLNIGWFFLIINAESSGIQISSKFDKITGKITNYVILSVSLLGGVKMILKIFVLFYLLKYQEKIFTKKKTF